MVYKIGWAGSDGRTFLSALVTSTAISEQSINYFQGVVIRGTSSMPKFAEIMDWPVQFIPTDSNSTEDYVKAIIGGFERGILDCVIPMPEALLFEGLVDILEKAGYGDRVAGLSQAGSFIEGDKIKCKELCTEYGIPVADDWTSVDAKNYSRVRSICLDYIDRFGGAVLKYPYSAGGKGSRVILNPWEIKEVYDKLIEDYKGKYKASFGQKGRWPLLIESRMSGFEISFTILVDKNGNYQILPTAIDYPARFPGDPDKNNPVTGGMASASPHPFESKLLLQSTKENIVEPLIRALKEKDILRPCVLYPGCFISLDSSGNLTRIRVSEVNIRSGEPEKQPVVRRIRNLGALIKAMFDGNLDEVEPEVREDQVALCIALVTGPGGPDGQKGYPGSLTKGEPMNIDFDYMKKKRIQVIPSCMEYSKEERVFKSDGSRVAFLNANATIKHDQTLADVADKLRNKLLNAFKGGKIRVIPREDKDGNRLVLREDAGIHFRIAHGLFS